MTKMKNKPDKIFDGGRRGVLRKTGVGALASLAATQLPTHWQQPVINAVVLPTHAQTSPPDPIADSAITTDGDIALLFTEQLDNMQLPGGSGGFTITLLDESGAQIPSMPIPHNVFRVSISPPDPSGVFPPNRGVLLEVDPGVNPPLTDLSSGQMVRVVYAPPETGAVLTYADSSRVEGFTTTITIE